MKYSDTYRLLLLRLGLVFIAYSLTRLCFFLMNLESFEEVALTDILFSFIHGLRFDASAILYTNIVFILLSILPFSFVVKSSWQAFLRVWFVVTNSIFLITNVADAEYVKFTGKRMDLSMFNMLQDVADQLGQLMLNYWYVSLVGLLVVVVLWKSYPMPYRHKRTLNWLFTGGILVVLALLIAIGLRGGLQRRPIQMLNAFSNGAKAGNLTANTPFSILTSVDKQQLKRKRYMSAEALEKQLPRTVANDSIAFSKQNVVIIILESFAAEFAGFMNDYQGYTPFLDSLAQEGVYFDHALANGLTSAESASSILTGIPNLMDIPVIFSAYQNNRYFSIFDHLKKEGYSTSFYHGGANGTMGFDVFTQNLGMQYFGQNEYPYEGDYDGTWGIFDEPYLQYVAEELGQKPEPFITTIFTLSSHNPYTIPAQYTGKFPKGDHPIHESIGYADYALKRFFKRAQQSTWYDSTLFIITADHTKLPQEKAYNNTLGYYKIPMVLFHPSGLVPQVDTTKLVQQLSIPASIMDYLGYPLDALPRFSTSVFDSTAPNEGLFYSNGIYYYITPQHQLRFVNDHIELYDWQDNRLPDEQIRQSDAKRLKAFIQYYNDGMIDNGF